MTDKDVAAYVEAMLSGRPTKPFSPTGEALEVIRAAVALRGAHASAVAPDPWFVERLHRQLAADSDHRPTPGLFDIPPVSVDTVGRPGTARSRGRRTGGRWLAPIGKAAAAVAVVAASVTAAITVNQRSTAPVAQRSLIAGTVRSTVLVDSNGRPLGWAYAYSGNPSWVFMDVRGSGLTGSYVCELHLTNGSTVPAGLVTIYNGSGDWAHTVPVRVGELRRATLETPAGTAVASATFG